MCVSSSLKIVFAKFLLSLGRIGVHPCDVKILEISVVSVTDIQNFVEVVVVRFHLLLQFSVSRCLEELPGAWPGSCTFQVYVV